MPKISPIHHKKFEKFLKYIGCTLARQVGDHKIYKKSGLHKPLVVTCKKDLPLMEIKSNLNTLKMSNEDYLNILSRL
ncbi:MAG: putative RNA binding protein YcfA (HicA-like mRNA interferase family) [Candidatus Omnitrophota bacterium]|jgi:predicted RNA binding protein YcfA (HicA-like mRNA interferase family)